MRTSSLRWVRTVMFSGVALIAGAVRGEVPKALANAVQDLRSQRSYSWEVINADPGAVAQSTETRRGTVTTVQQNFAPHILGTRDSNGDILLKRDWPDGLQMDTLVTVRGQIVTKTPEGWLNNQEVVNAMAEERMNNTGPSPRSQYLRRSDRPDIRRPDEELAAAVAAAEDFEVNGDTYVAHIQIGENAGARSGLSALNVTLTVNLSRGVVRDYQLTVQGSRSMARVGVNIPVSDDHFVILTYIPVRKLDVPDEAWAKVTPAKR